MRKIKVRDRKLDPDVLVIGVERDNLAEVLKFEFPENLRDYEITIHFENSAGERFFDCVSASGIYPIKRELTKAGRYLYSLKFIKGEIQFGTTNAQLIIEQRVDADDIFIKTVEPTTIEYILGSLHNLDQRLAFIEGFEGPEGLADYIDAAIGGHNDDEESHSDIRALVNTQRSELSEHDQSTHAHANMQLETLNTIGSLGESVRNTIKSLTENINESFENIDKEINSKIAFHDENTNAHSEIRALIENLPQESGSEKWVMYENPPSVIDMNEVDANCFFLNIASDVTITVINAPDNLEPIKFLVRTEAAVAENKTVKILFQGDHYYKIYGSGQVTFDGIKKTLNFYGTCQCLITVRRQKTGSVNYSYYSDVSSLNQSNIVLGNYGIKYNTSSATPSFSETAGYTIVDLNHDLYIRIPTHDEKMPLGIRCSLSVIFTGQSKITVAEYLTNPAEAYKLHWGEAGPPSQTFQSGNKLWIDFWRTSWGTFARWSTTSAEGLYIPLLKRIDMLESRITELESSDNPI